MVNTLEIACLSSAAAAALAYLAYRVAEGQPTLPVEVDGDMVFVPKILFDILSDLRSFSVRYEPARRRIHEGPRLPDDQFAVVLQADRKWEVIQDEFNALYERVTITCAKDGEVEDDLVSFREQQKGKIHEVQELMSDHLTPPTIAD